jgi:hypothetical protein
MPVANKTNNNVEPTSVLSTMQNFLFYQNFQVSQLSVYVPTATVQYLPIKYLPIYIAFLIVTIVIVHYVRVSYCIVEINKCTPLIKHPLFNYYII